jgi:hypothetical protein
MYLFIIGALVIVLGFAAARMRNGKIAKEVRKRSHTVSFESHGHDSLVHDHQHPHVTHNQRQGGDMVMGEWEHLTSEHGHQHNHPSVEHSHQPHEDPEHEHLGEAHIHDHEHPAKS